MPALIKKLAVAAAAFLATVVLAELAVRVASDPAFDAEGARRRARETVEQMTGNRWSGGERDAEASEDDDYPEWVLHPYYGYDVGSTDVWTASDLEKLTSPRAARSIDILILGGSVADGLGKDSHRQITRALEDDPRWSGWNVRVFREGRGGFRQPQQLHLLEYLLAVGLQPDIVIELDGFNEVALGLQNALAGVHPVMPSISHWAHLASNAPLTPRAMDQIGIVRTEQRRAAWILAEAKRFGLFHSVLTARLAQKRIDGCYARYAEADRVYRELLESQTTPSYAKGPALEPGDDATLELCARIWRDSSLDMDALCRRRGIRYVHFLQPTLHDEGSKPLTADEIRTGVGPPNWGRGAKLGYPKLREKGRELVERGVEFVDTSGVFVDQPQTLYYDVCHFAPEGNRILAERMLATLRERPPPPAPARPDAPADDGDGTSR